MPQTVTEKIIAAHAAESAVSAGGIATVTPDVLMLNDVSGPLAFDQFEAMGADRPAAPGRVVLVDGAPLDGEVAAILAGGGLMARTRQILAGRSVAQHEVRNG